MAEKEFLTALGEPFGKLFLDRVVALRAAKPLSRGRYYFFGFFADSEGRPTHGYQTEWIGYSEGPPRREIRQASLVLPRETMQALASAGTPGLLVNRADDLPILWVFGGYGVVERRAAESLYPGFHKPKEMARDSSELGFQSVSSLDKAALLHAPSKRLRVQVLKRDQARCVLCGRSPADNVDVQLQLHHVIPWGKGGLTEARNLLTLCHTCHGGLDPHHDEFLRRFVEKGEATGHTYAEELFGYRQALRRSMEEAA